MKTKLCIVISCFMLCNCISYYKYEKEPLGEIKQISREKIKVNILYERISLQKTENTSPCLDILEDDFIDDPDSEFSVSVRAFPHLENNNIGFFYSLVHFSFTIATYGIVPYKQEILCNYEVKVLKKDKLIFKSQDSYREKTIITAFFLFLIPFRSNEEDPSIINKFKENNVFLIRKAVQYEK